MYVMLHNIRFEKKYLVFLVSETERRDAIKAQLEQDINRRVQEAFGEPPRYGAQGGEFVGRAAGRGGGRHGRTQSADQCGQQRSLEELERLNAHIDLTDREQVRT